MGSRPRLRDPDVEGARPAWPVRGEVETERILRDGRTKFREWRIHRGPEVLWRRPLRIPGRCGKRKCGEDQRGESNQGSIHGRPPCDCPNHLPLRVRVDIQRSFPPNPPGRLEAKMSVRASNERVGVRSLNTVLNGGPALVGVFHWSWMLCRVDVQMSLPPTEPALGDPKNISRPSFRMVTAASLTGGDQGLSTDARRETQMSRPPRPPGRSELKYSVSSSFDKNAFCSLKVELTSPRFVAPDHSELAKERADDSGTS